MKPKVGIVGDGNVGTALKKGLDREGYECRNTGKDPNRVRDLGSWADVLVLAVPFAERENAIRELGGAHRGKVLVDVTNALTEKYDLAVEPTRESGAEQLARMAEGAKVVKAFNTVFAKHMSEGKVNGEPLTLFVAGDDGKAKDAIRDLGRDLGFDAIDAGPLKNARWMETLGLFNIRLGYDQNLGTDIGFKLVH